MKTGFYSHPLFLEHDTGAHPENAERLRAIRNRLQSEGILDQLELRSGRQATSQDISMLHSEDLFEQVRQASEEGRQNLQSPDCVVSEQTFSAALQAVGSVLEAVEEVAERRLDNAFCAVRPPVIMRNGIRPWGSVFSTTSPWQPNTLPGVSDTKGF